MEKEKETNANADALLVISVPGSDEEAYGVIEAFKKVFNAKMKAEEGVSIGKIDSCLHMNRYATPTAPMHGAARFCELYDYDDIGYMFGEMRGMGAEVLEAIETLEKYEFVLSVIMWTKFHTTNIYIASHPADTPIEELVTEQPLETIG